MLLLDKPTGWYPMPLSSRVPSDQSKSDKQRLHFSWLHWPVADPGKCVKTISPWDQDKTQNSGFSWTSQSLQFSTQRSPALGRRGGAGSFCRWEGWHADWHPAPGRLPRGCPGLPEGGSGSRAGPAEREPLRSWLPRGSERLQLLFGKPVCLTCLPLPEAELLLGCLISPLRSWQRQPEISLLTGLPSDFPSI